MDITLVIIIISSVVGVVFVIALCKYCFCNDLKSSNVNHSGAGGFVARNRRKSSRDDSFTGTNDNMYVAPFSADSDIHDTTEWDTHHHDSSKNDCSGVPESHSHHDTGASDHCTSTWESPSTCDTSCTVDTSCTSTCDTSTYD